MRSGLTAVLAIALLAGRADARQAQPDQPAPPAAVTGIPVSFLMDLGSGQVLHARQADLSFVPASMAKVMTAFVAFEEITAGRLSPDRQFTVGEATARAWNGRGSSLNLAAGMKVSANDLLRGIATVSANDAAIVLAEGYAGNVPAWTFLMNDAAGRLGMTASRFNTPNGWPDSGRTYVSARDLARLSQAMITRYPVLYHRYFGHKRMEWNGRVLESHDPTIGVVRGADGIKTGHTREAGFNFLGSAQRDGRRLVMVVAGAKTAESRAAASRALLDWGFAEWAARPLFKPGAVVGEARVQDGKASTLLLVTANPVYAVTPRGAPQPISLRLVYKGPLVAPVAKGAQVAELEVRTGTADPSRVPLYAANAVTQAGFFDRVLNGLMSIFS